MENMEEEKYLKRRDIIFSHIFPFIEKNILNEVGIEKNNTKFITIFEKKNIENVLEILTNQLNNLENFLKNNISNSFINIDEMFNSLRNYQKEMSKSTFSWIEITLAILIILTRNPRFSFF
jgi:hypothetical protein